MSELPKLLHAHAIRLRASHLNLDASTIEYFLREGAQIATERADALIHDIRMEMKHARIKANSPQ